MSDEYKPREADLSGAIREQQVHHLADYILRHAPPGVMMTRLEAVTKARRLVTRGERAPIA